MERIEQLSKMPLIRFVGLTWVPVLIVYALPNTWWGLLLKAILIIWIIVVIRASFSPTWAKYETLGAFLIFNTACFAGLLWIANPDWFRYVFSFLLVLSFATQFHQIDNANKDNKPL